MDPLPAQHPASPFIIEKRNFSLGPDQITCNSKVLISPSYSTSAISSCLSSFPMPSPASSDHHPSSTYWILSPTLPDQSLPTAGHQQTSANEESRQCFRSPPTVWLPRLWRSSQLWRKFKQPGLPHSLKAAMKELGNPLNATDAWRPFSKQSDLMEHSATRTAGWQSMGAADESLTSNSSNRGIEMQASLRPRPRPQS